MRKRANPFAGQGRLNAPVGKHTRNPGWKPGEHWLCCQRCGFDYYSKDMMKEWSGAIVCKSCWEPRHPQDFVRARPERIQAPGLKNPCGLTNQTAAEGSTDLPPPTFNLGSPTVTDITGAGEDNCFDAGLPISTITGAVFGTFTDTYGELITVVSYSADYLPPGISISSSTGDITGTLATGSDSENGMTTRVTALYSNGQRISANPFTWCIIDAGLAPDELGCNIFGWWDFSTNAYAYSDTSAETLVTDEDLVEVMKSRATPACADLVVLSGGAEAGASPWNDEVRNELGAWTPDYDNHSSGANAGHLRNNNPFVGMFTEGAVTPMTVVGVLEMASSSPTDDFNRNWFGSDVSLGHQIGLGNSATAGYAVQLQTQRTNPTPVNEVTYGPVSHNIYAGDWHMWCMTLDGTGRETRVEINDQLLAGGTFAHDDWDLAQTGVQLGAQNIATASNAPHYGWGSPIGEVIVFACALTAEQKTSLFKYMQAKWQLSSYPGSS